MVTVYYSAVIVTVRQLRHFKIGIFIWFLVAFFRIDKNGPFLSIPLMEGFLMNYDKAMRPGLTVTEPTSPLLFYSTLSHSLSPS